MGTKDKIREYLKYKGLTAYRFETIAKLSPGILKTGTHFRTDQLKPIKENFPDLNMNWLLYDEGEMIVSDVSTVNEEQDIYQKTGIVEHLKALLQSKDETIEAQKETIAILKDRLGMANKSKVG